MRYPTAGRNLRGETREAAEKGNVRGFIFRCHSAERITGAGLVSVVIKTIGFVSAELKLLLY